MSAVFAAFDRAKELDDDVQCQQLLLLASREQGELKAIVANMQAGDAACVLLDFQMKAQESLVSIERGLNAMREEIQHKLDRMDSKLDMLLGLDVLEHMNIHLTSWVKTFPTRPQVTRLFYDTVPATHRIECFQEVYIESKLIGPGNLKDFKENAGNPARPAMAVLKQFVLAKASALADSLQTEGVAKAESTHQATLPTKEVVLLTGIAGTCFACPGASS